MAKVYNKILICSEAENPESGFLEAAAEVARWLKPVEVIVLRASYQDSMIARLASEYEHLTPSLESMRDDLEEQVGAFFKAPEGVAVRCEVRVGNTLGEIARMALLEDVDLLIVGRGESEGDFPRHGLARRLAYKSACSVLALPSNQRLGLDRVLVPVRNSPCSIRALQAAIDIATSVVEAPEIIVHCVYHVSAGYARIGRSFEEVSAELLNYAQDEVTQVIDAVDVKTARIQRVFSEDHHDQPAQLIQDMAKKYNVGSVFIGSRGRTGAAGIILGHVTENLLTDCPQPVFAIKEKGESLGLLQALGLIV